MPEADERGNWIEVLQHWGLVEADLHEHYGIDLDDPVLANRTWRWFRVRVLGLIDAPPVWIPTDKGFRAVPSTRLGLALNPPS